jgi:hypothetical protein
MLEHPAMAYGRAQHRRRDRAHPWARPQPLTRRMRVGQACERLVVIGALRRSGDTRLTQLPTPLPAQGRARVLLGLERLRHGVMARRHPCGQHAPIVMPQPVHVSDQRGPLIAAPLTPAGQGWEIWLAAALGGDHTPGRAHHRFSDGLGLAPILLVRTDPPCPVMRPATGVYPDEHRGQLGDNGHQGIACQTRAPEDCPRRVSPHEMTHVCGQIDRTGVKRLLQGTRLLAGP